MLTKQVEENEKIQDERDILKSINKVVNNYLQQCFKRDVFFYLQMQIQKKTKSLWDTIEFIENVNRDAIFNDLKHAINEYQNEIKTRVLFFEGDKIPEDKQIVEISFPFFYNNSIAKWNKDKQIFFVKSIYPSDKAVKADIKEVSVYEKIFLDIMRESINNNASDIHIIPKNNAYYVFFRMDGFFIEKKHWKMSQEDGDGLITYLMRKCASFTKGSQFNPDTRITYQDARISLLEIGDYDARVAFIPDGFSLKNMEVVIRLLKKDVYAHSSDVLETLRNLGVLLDDCYILNSMLSKNRGVCVISGITNSGKSTLVNALLSSVKNKKVGSVEDPIEYFVNTNNFMQHQLFLSEENKLKMDFVDYIKAFKRADYDIVFVGEWRNHEGLSQSIIEQSFAGQLIFTTLHIANSFQIFEALHYMYNVKFEEIRSVLLLSWNQILLPKLCDKCKKIINEIPAEFKNSLKKKMDISVVLDDRTKTKLENFVAKQGEFKFYQKGDGCENCFYTGYKGRQVVYDYFVPNYLFWEKLSSYSYFNVLSTAEQTTKYKTKIDTYMEFIKLGKLSIFDIIGNDYVPSLI